MRNKRVRHLLLGLLVLTAFAIASEMDYQDEILMQQAKQLQREGGL